MLNSKKITEKIIKNFPRWMDIRKRHNKSTGGALIHSISDEIEKIQGGIDEYIKGFFLETCCENEEDIVDYLYRVHIGDIDPAGLIMVQPELTFVESLEEFYSKEESFYYSDGYLFVKTEDLSENKVVEYSIDNYTYSETPEIHHVWNVFDEFAMFVGIKRQKHESNKELKKRILLSFDKNESVEDGFIRSITTALTTATPDIKSSDIKIEPVTAENYNMIHSEGESISETLSKVNKDVYKYKTWDTTPWSHDIDSVEYISHTWDEKLSAYSDGIGKEEDLHVALYGSNDTTDATILLYNKNKESLYSYLKENEKRTSIEIKAKKFSKEVIQDKISLKLIATPVKEITDKTIYIDSGTKRDYVGKFNMRNNLNTSNSESIEIEDDSLIKKDGYYKMVFRNEEVKHGLKILECKLKTASHYVNLLKENEKFRFDNDNNLIYRHTKRYAKWARDYDLIENLTDSDNGITLVPGEAQGSATLELEECSLEPVSFLYECDLSPLDKEDLEIKGFTATSPGVYESVNLPVEKSIVLEKALNQYSFKTEGDCKIKITDGDDVEEQIHQGVVEHGSDLQSSARNIKIEIFALGANSRCVVSNFEYAHFNLSMSLKHGSLSANSMGETFLPPLDNNTLTVTIESFSDKAPKINSFLVGCTETEMNYVTDVFEAKKSEKLSVEYEGFKVDLIEVDSSGSELNSPNNIIDFNPDIKIRAIKNSAIASFYMDDHYEIHDAFSDAGSLNLNRANKQLFVVLKQEEILKSINITGRMITQNPLAILNNVFDIRQIRGDKLYVMNNGDSFIVEKNSVQSKVSISDTDYFKSISKSNYFSFKGHDEDSDVSQVFIRKGGGEYVSDDKGYYSPIESMVLRYKDNAHHVSYRTDYITAHQSGGNFIANNFHPFLVENQLYYYEIVESIPRVNVSFYHKHEDDSYYNWIVGASMWYSEESLFVLYQDKDYHKNSIFVSEEVTINKECKLEQTVQLENLIDLGEGKLEDVRSMLLSVPDGYSIGHRINDTTNVEEAPEFFGSETGWIQVGGVTKLNMCNVHRIIDFYYKEGEKKIAIDEEWYELHEEVGYISFKPDAPNWIQNKAYIILYSVKIPSAIGISDDMLYKEVENSVNGYYLTERIEGMYDLEDGDVVDLSSNQNFKEADKRIIHCANPQFNASLVNNSVVFERAYDEDTLFIRSGYYYVNGDEYYVFSQQASEKTNKDMNVEFNNVIKDGALYLQRASRNYLGNSMLNLGTSSPVFLKDFSKNNNTSGASLVDSITPCESFNSWKTIASSMSFSEGLNGLGIKIIEEVKGGYAHIKIKNSKGKKITVSMYATADIKAYLAKEKVLDGMFLPKSDSMVIVEQLKDSIMGQSIITGNIDCKESDAFLLIKGEGVIDDIIVKEWDGKPLDFNTHKKNIDLTGLAVDEQAPSDMKRRVLFNKDGNYRNLGAEVNQEGFIVNSPMLNWGITKLREYSTYADWRYGTLDNAEIQNNIVQTNELPGNIVTEPIFVGDPKMIKNLIIKLDDIEQKEGEVPKITLLTSDSHNGVFETKTSFVSSLGVIKTEAIKSMKQYVKIRVDLPRRSFFKTLTLFTEYKESKDVTPAEKINSNGQYESEIYDTYYQKNYTLTDIQLNRSLKDPNVLLYIRGAGTNEKEDIWTPWKEINEDTINKIHFDNCRFFQLKVHLRKIKSSVKIDYFDLKIREDK